MKRTNAYHLLKGHRSVQTESNSVVVLRFNAVNFMSTKRISSEEMVGMCELVVVEESCFDNHHMQKIGGTLPLLWVDCFGEDVGDLFCCLDVL